MKKVILPLLLIFSFELISQNYYHDTQGVLEVSNSGQAVYTVPIAMPPSIQDVGPTINLVYSSGALGGIAGQGWSISSISNISRISTRRDIDGFVDGVDFDANDKLALDGQRLILVSGTYWGSGSIYETETKSNTKVELHGSGSSIYFIVTSPDGSRAWYGNYGGFNAYDISSYYIARFEDTNGNYITYHYTRPNQKGMCIDEIRFSANIHGIQPVNKIKFYYKLAKRTENFFLNGQKHEKLELLDKIEVETNNLLFKRYQITHDEDPQLAYQRVTQIQEFNSELEPANPIIFNYTTSVMQSEGSETITTFNSDLNFSDIRISGDFDGDGRLDFITNDKMYTKLFLGSNLGSTFNINETLSNKRFTTTIVKNNKLNQFNSIVSPVIEDNNLKLRFLSLINNQVVLDFENSYAINNQGICVGDCPNNPCQNFQNFTHQFYEGDFNGDGRPDVFVIMHDVVKQSYWVEIGPGDPHVSPDPDITFPFYECRYNTTISNQPNGMYMLNISQGSSSFQNLSVNLPNFNFYSAKKIVGDFDGDGKSDLLVIYNDFSYYRKYLILSFINDNTGIQIIGEGTISDYISDKDLLLGDFNGDGKVDLIIPNGNGSNSQRDDKLWHIYYANPNPNGGVYFTKESHEIVEYWPHSGNHFSTQTHLSNYYAIDTNGDGKSDIVRIWRKHYKPQWTINDHNTQWNIKSYVNNIGNTNISGTKFPLDYQSPCISHPILGQLCDHDSDSPEIPTPIVSTYRYQDLNREIVMVRKHNNQVTYINFSKDVLEDSMIRSVSTSGGNIVDQIEYKALVPDVPGTNGLGTLSQFYSSNNSVNFPMVEIKSIPNMKAVSKLKNISLGIEKSQDFRYHGFVVNLNGIGSIGFRKIARSTWYQSAADPRIWNIEEYNPLWRGALQRKYTQLRTPGSSFTFVNSGNPTGIINSTTNSFVSYTNAGVYNIFLNNQTYVDFLTNVRTVKNYTYSTPYLLPETIVTLNYHNQNTLQSTLTTTTEFENNPTGSGSDYFIGRPIKITTTQSAYNDTYISEEKYTYENKKLTKKESRGNSTDNVYLTEDYEYFNNGNLKKKILSAPGAIPSVSSRTIEYTYDTSQRFIKTEKDIEGLITTFNSYHPIYGVVLSVSNPYGLTTVSEYDSWGKRTKVTDYLNNSKYFTYTKNNGTYTTLETSDDGGSSIVEMDALSRVVKKGSKNISGQWAYVSIEYDFLNRKTKESQPYFGTSPNQWTQYSYDIYNRLIQETFFTGKVTTFTYSGLTSTVNDGVTTKSSVKNANGHVTMTSDPGGLIYYTYYANGNLKSSTFDGSSQLIEYDSWGRKTKLTDPSAGVYQYEYNIYGEILKEITPKGTTTYSYNPAGKIIGKNIFGDHTSIYSEYVYNQDKTLWYIDSWDGNGNAFVTEYYYDSFKRLINVNEVNIDTYFEKRYQYDSFGRIDKEYFEALDYNSGKSSSKWIKNTYLNGYHWQILDDATQAMLWQIDAVNERGQVVTAHYGNAVGQISNTYDNFGFPLTSSYRTINGNNASSTPFLALATNFNAQRGLLLSRSNSMFNWNETFQYDNLERLTHFTNKNGQTEQQYYDNKGRISQNSVGDYFYDSTAKPYQATKVSLSQDAIQHYTDKPLQQITYNAFKSPVSIYEEGVERIDYEYNHFQTRSTMYYGGLQTDKTTRPLRKYFSSDAVMEIKKNTLLNTVEFITYIGGDGYTAPVLLKSDGTTQHYYYLHRDYLGSIMAISDAAGLVVEKRHFDAWGNIVFLKDQHNNNLTTFAVVDRGYTGHEHLQAVGLIHMNGRLYDSHVRRFLSPDNYIQDPTNTQNFNRYGYVLNNPLKYTDPSGEVIEFGVAVLIGAGISALTYTITALTADVPFTVGGLIKSAAVGAFTSTVTFGIGEAGQLIEKLASRIVFQALAHGSFQGLMSGLQGGDFWTGFASGSISSLASSLWSGGKNISYDDNNNMVVKTWDGFGGKFSQSTTGIIAFGTIAGGAGAALTKGNFWQGAVTGLVVSALNHALHKDSSMDFEENITTDPPHVGVKKPTPNPQDLHESFKVPKGAKWKNRGGRPTIINKKGEVLQWDSQKGEIEKYNPKTKEHKGGFDPNTGKFRPGSIDKGRVPNGGWKLFSIGRFFMLDFLIYHTLKAPESYMQDSRVFI